VYYSKKLIFGKMISRDFYGFPDLLTESNRVSDVFKHGMDLTAASILSDAHQSF